MTDTLDVRVRAYLAHLSEPERCVNGRFGDVEARTLSEMLDAGFEVRDAWGPVQMDVWRVNLERGPVTVQTGIERGFSDGIQLGVRGLKPQPGNVYDGRSFELVHFVWAIRTDAPQAGANAVHLIDWSDRSPDWRRDVLAEWRQVVDWLDHATAVDVAAIARVSDARSSLLNRIFFGEVQPAHPTVAELDEAGRELVAAARG